MELNSLEEINKVLDFNFKNSLKLSSLEVSCPNCYKLYSINPHEIMTTQPQFNCRECSAQFYINYPDCLEETRIIGKTIEREASIPELKKPINEVSEASIEVKKEAENQANVVVTGEPKKVKIRTHEPVMSCPKCNYVNVATSIECIKCAVILSKAKVDRDYKASAYASPELKDLWNLVLDNYDSEASHQNFIRYSGLEKNLEFASQKYNLILSVNPHDEIANKNKSQIHELAALEVRKQAVVKPAKNIFSIFNLWTLSFLLSFSIIGFGLYFNQHKNLIGIGAFSLTLIAGLKFLQSRYK